MGIFDINMRLFETLTLATAVNGHGRLMNPPGRSSLRFFPNDPAIAPFWSSINPNYNDNELYCGGLGVQIQNDYKCGICGDDFMKTRPRDNELSGRYGNSGIIPRTYETGGSMPIEIQITAHHQGFFEFRLCKTIGLLEDAPCYENEKSLLRLENGDTKFDITDSKPTRPGETGWWYKFDAIIQDDVECDHCVLQWRYHTANSWGSDEHGTGLGYGYQEEFYGCADVEVINTGAPLPSSSTYTSSSTSTTRTGSSTSSFSTTTTTTTTTTKTGDTFSCRGLPNGLYPHEQCDMYYECYGSNPLERACGPGLEFNPSMGICDWPHNNTNENCQRML